MDFEKRQENFGKTKQSCKIVTRSSYKRNQKRDQSVSADALWDSVVTGDLDSPSKDQEWQMVVNKRKVKKSHKKKQIEASLKGVPPTTGSNSVPLESRLVFSSEDDDYQSGCEQNKNAESEKVDNTVFKDLSDIQFVGTYENPLPTLTETQIRKRIATLKVEADLCSGNVPNEKAMIESDPAVLSIISDKVLFQQPDMSGQGNSILNQLLQNGQVVKNQAGNSSTHTSPTHVSPNPSHQALTLSQQVTPPPPPPPNGVAISNVRLQQTYTSFIAQVTQSQTDLKNAVDLYNKQQFSMGQAVSAMKAEQESQKKKVVDLTSKVRHVERLARNGNTLLLKEHGLTMGSGVKDWRKRLAAANMVMFEALAMTGEYRVICKPIKTDFITPRKAHLASNKNYQPTIRVYFPCNWIWDIITHPDFKFGDRMKAWHAQEEVKGGSKPRFSINEDLSWEDLQKKNYASTVLKNFKDSFTSGPKPKGIVTRYFGIRIGDNLENFTSYKDLANKYQKFLPKNVTQPFLVSTDVDMPSTSG